MQILQNKNNRPFGFWKSGKFEQFESKFESNWHWLKMVKNGHFLIKNEFQRPRFGGVFLITKSVSLLWWGTDFDLWKSFQSRLLRPNGRLRRKNFYIPTGMSMVRWSSHHCFIFLKRDFVSKFCQNNFHRSKSVPHHKRHTLFATKKTPKPWTLKFFFK